MQPFIGKAGLEAIARCDQGVQIDAGVEAFGLQQVHQILGGHIQPIRRERTPAESRQRRVETAHSCIERSLGIGQRSAERVVKMKIAELVSPLPIVPL